MSKEQFAPDTGKELADAVDRGLRTGELKKVVETDTKRRLAWDIWNEGIRCLDGKDEIKIKDDKTKNEYVILRLKPASEKYKNIPLADRRIDLVIEKTAVEANPLENERPEKGTLESGEIDKLKVLKTSYFFGLRDVWKETVANILTREGRDTQKTEPQGLYQETTLNELREILKVLESEDTLTKILGNKVRAGATALLGDAYISGIALTYPFRQIVIYGKRYITHSSEFDKNLELAITRTEWRYSDSDQARTLSPTPPVTFLFPADCNEAISKMVSINGHPKKVPVEKRDLETLLHDINDKLTLLNKQTIR